MKKLLLICWLFLVPLLIAAQDADNVKITQRFDVRKKIDGKYVGLFYGYLSGVWNLKPMADGTTAVEARYYLMQESRHDNAMLEKPLQAELKSTFTLNAKGFMNAFQGDGVPYYRNFPQRPPTDAAVGSSWVGNGEIAQDIQGNGQYTRIPILIEYRWKGESLYGERKVWEITAKYALRYSKGQDPKGDFGVEKAQGTHDAWIYFDKETLQPVFMRETTKEQYQAAGKTLYNEGIIMTFYENVPYLDKAKETLKIAGDIGKASIPDVQVQEDERGVKLTLQNLLFVADQPKLLPGETDRLDKIAEILKATGNRSILVIGHTADVGSQESQVKLSIERAQAIIEALKARGIAAKRLIYDGRGGREPVAENTSEAGRAKNRRVEMIVLND